MPERQDQKNQPDQPHQRVDHKGNQHHGQHIEQPRAHQVPPLGQQNQGNWKPHTEHLRPQERQHQHIISPQVDPHRLNLNPPDMHQRRNEQFQHQWQNQFRPNHFRIPPGIQFGPQINQLGDWNYGGYRDQRQYQNRHFRNPYDGMNNFFRDCDEDNFYFDGNRHRHHRDNDFLPFLLEGIGEIIGGTLMRELDKVRLDGRQAESNQDAEDIDDNDIDETENRATRDDFSPDKQISMNLEFKPQGQTSTEQLNSGFERTG